MKINLKQIIVWCDRNLLFYLSLFLLLFIPLWPKIPLADLIPGYIVRLRLEDILVFITFIIYLIQIYRQKVNWQMPTWKLIIANISLGLMGILSGMLLINTIPLETLHIGKSLLHWARYIEYFFLAFLFFSTLNNRKQIKILFITMLIAVSAISLYGIGQKYFYWPLYSTMNREFSKGIKLYLTPHARVQSTFGGHYDFAAYLVLLLPFTLLLAKNTKTKWKKCLIWLVHILGLWSLIVSAARTSIVAYFVSVLIIYTIYYFINQQDRLKQKIKNFLGHLIVYFGLLGVLIFFFGHDMIERFSHTLENIEPIRNAYHTANKWRLELPYLLGWKEIEPPANALAVVVDELGNNMIASMPKPVVTPTDSRPKPTRPADVYEDIPDIIYEIDATGEVTMIEATRTWSVNAEKYGLSMAIRLDTLWPNAWRGFLRNPLLGSGYGMINKGESINLLTDADSTDNNYLRTLGETGILGFLTFYGLSLTAIWMSSKNLRNKNNELNLINLAFLSGAIGFLINAAYIDVFAASKAAFTFWMVYGIFWANQKINKQL